MKNEYITTYISKTGERGLFSFLGPVDSMTRDQALEALERVKAYCDNSLKNTLKTWANHHKTTNDQATKKMFKQTLGYELVSESESLELTTYQEWEAQEYNNFLALPVELITEQKYNDMLDILPPIRWGNRDGCESFFMSEFQTGCYTAQYLKTSIEGRDIFATKLVHFDRPESWVKHDQIVKSRA